MYTASRCEGDVPLSFRKTAMWLVRKRPYEMNANNHRRYGEWETFRRASDRERATELAQQEALILPRGMWDVGVFFRGRRVWPS